MEHHASPTVRDSHIEKIVSDGSDRVHMHLDNGILLAFVATLVNGMPTLTLHVVEPGEQLMRATH